MLRRAWRRFRPKAKVPLVPTSDTKSLLDSLLRQAPAAAQAQHQMDSHSHSYHTNKTRLYELIDFNDTFVALALSLKPEERSGFVERLKADMARACQEQHMPMFTDEQFEAITKGLSREVAVYLGALSQGFQARMTTRAQDAMGVDMVITDPVSKQSLNVDCKTPSAYHFRIKDLVEQGRMSEQDAERADLQGFAHEVNGQGDEAVAVTLLRIDPNEMGDIKDFVFTDSGLFGRQLRTVFSSR